MDMTYYYKVVSGGLSICSQFHCEPVPSEFVLKYEIGKVTIPAIGPIFVFDSLINAREWALRMSWNNTQILKGTGVVSKYQRWCCGGTRAWRRAWRNPALRDVAPVPGTVFLRSFTPLEIVT